MKHFLRALGLRASDLFRSYGVPPYSYTGKELQSMTVLATYSLERALRDAPVDPATTAPGSRMGTKYVMIGAQQHELRQDRFGRTHLPNVIKHRLFSA